MVLIGYFLLDNGIVVWVVEWIYDNVLSDLVFLMVLIISWSFVLDNVDGIVCEDYNILLEVFD